jgi:hypothetical protein
MEPTTPGPQELWNFFPLVMCINVRERKERLEEAQKELSNVGLSKVVFYRSARQPDRDKAIIDAHMACLRYAIEQQVPYALIFEDDVSFQEGYQQNLRRAIQFMESRSDWNLFHFGGFIFRRTELVSPYLVRGGILTAHAYVIRTEFARQALEKRPYCSGMSIDLFYSCLNGNFSVASINPMICIQRPSESDGTWDKRSVNKSGWLGNAMIYTSLNLPEKLRFNRFSILERVRIENGVSFFKVYRNILRGKLKKAEKEVKAGRRPAISEYPLGEYQIVQLSGGAAEFLVG